MSRRFDLICVGRCMVDLYCDQIGTPISGGQSLSMYTGGCPTNIAVGASRQGLRVAMLTRVGADDTGRFVIETLAREGIDTTHVRVDDDARTPMVLAGIEPPDRFSLTWYRERAADLEVDLGDYDDAFLADAAAILISGNTLSRRRGRVLARDLASRCRRLGTRVVYDIDFRPTLWYTESAAGNRTPVPAQEIAETLQAILQYVDLLVGTEEEYAALSGDAGFDGARALIPGMAILKLGKDGALVAPRGQEPVRAGGFPVRVFNTLGAGDAFISGFLAGWLRDQPLKACFDRANASGAIVVTRHGCSPAMPYDAEIKHFLAETHPRGVSPQDDAALDRLHAAGARPPRRRPLCVLAIDHRVWFQDVAGAGRDEEIRGFKRVAVEAARARFEREGLSSAFGVILDAQYGDPTLAQLRRDSGIWHAEPIERGGMFPLALLGPGGDPGLALRERPRGGVVKLLLSCTSDAAVQRAQAAVVSAVQAACVAWSRELLLELILRDERVNLADCMAELLDVGVTPDYWKIPIPKDEAAWAVQRAVVARDPSCHGVLFLGGHEPLDALRAQLECYAADPIALGFAVGRTLFEAPFRAWLEGARGNAAVEPLCDGLVALARPWAALAATS
ncbi:MAG: 5-dehydro-2-deoxygluconokinase [Armatimonadetes bacterium]|nr:5-dehydro-2-deoxygluconokinase [Armatimonadota bacterium]